MRVHLDERWTRHLCRIPESGMGYHRVHVSLRDGQEVKDVVVFNAEELDWPLDQRTIGSDDIAEIRAATY